MSSLALLEGRTEPTRQQPYNEIGTEEAAAAARVLASRNLSGFLGRAGSGFLGGPEVLALEKEFSDTFGVRHAVSFNSASTALQAAVTAIGVGPGDEVITSPYTMSATPSAVLLNGAVPVFADVDEMTGCLDAQSVASRVTPRTKAILVVNLFGMPADYDALQKIADEHDLFIIEDNAQAAGATYRGKQLGTIGDIGVYSLNVHKIVQCGEGAVLVTGDDHLAYRSQLVRNHGEVIVDDLIDEKEFEPVVGTNFRLSEVHAAIAREQLKKLPRLTDIRQRQTAYLTNALKRFSWLALPELPAHVTSVWYQYPFRFFSDRIGGLSREMFARAMKAEGFPLGVGYVKPLYWFPLYQRKQMYPRSQFPFVSTEYPSDVSYAKGICPVVERLWEKEMLTTTVFLPPNTEETLDAFVDAIARIEANADALRAYEKNNSAT